MLENPQIPWKWENDLCAQEAHLKWLDRYIRCRPVGQGRHRIELKRAPTILQGKRGVSYGSHCMSQI